MHHVIGHMVGYPLGKARYHHRGTSGSSVRHFTTVSLGMLIPTSDYFRYLTLVSGVFVVSYWFGLQTQFALIGIRTSDLSIFSPILYYYATRDISTYI